MSRNIERIFVVGEGGHLCSLRFTGEQYADEDEGELRRCLRQWQDAEHLVDFFLDHRNDLQGGFFGKKSLEDFIFLTEREAVNLIKKIHAAANAPTPSQLHQLFKPLHNNEIDETDRPKYQFLKAKGEHPRTWLRLYGLRTKDDVYFITGGAIKLNHRMDDRDHLGEELRKMEAARKHISRFLRQDETFYDFFALIT